MRLLIRLICMGMLASICYPISGVFAQDYRELQYAEVTGVNYLFSEPNQSLLIIESTVQNLSFESNKGVVSVELVEPGVWHVRLESGVQLVKIRAEGFLPLELHRYTYKQKTVRKIRVTAFGASGGFDINRPELTLLFDVVSDDEEVYVQLDNNPPQKMSFAAGAVTLRPTSGQHSVLVFASGRVWETTLTLEPGEMRKETVQLRSGTTENLDEVQLGNLFIESNPAGATIFLNQVKQQGLTPLTLNDLRPGTYDIEIVADLHLPTTRTVEVRELTYTDVNEDLTPNYGRVRIASEPAGALVYINDQQRGITPLDIPRFDAGQYQLRLVQQLYYEEIDTFSVEPGIGFERTYELKPQFGSLTVTSTPPGAIIEVDGANWGTTPQTRNQVFSGTHVVRVLKENYYTQEKQVEIFDGTHPEIPFLLSSSVGFLAVESTPPGATVTVTETGERLGVTPLRDVALDPGTYTLQLELDNYETADRSVPVSLAGTPSIAVDLVRKTGHLRVETSPPRANVFLNGTRHGTTPTLINDLPTGTYTIRVEKNGYDIQESIITVQYREITDYSQSLGTEGTELWKTRRNQARLFSIVPGGGQIASPNQWWRGVLYMGGMGAAGFLVYQANADFTSAEDDYNAAMAGYRSSISQTEIDLYFENATDAHQEMDSSQQQMNIMIIAASSVYAISIIDAWLFGGGPKPVATGNADASVDWQPIASVTEKHLCLGISLQF